MAKEKTTSALGRLTGGDLASARAYSKEEYQRTLEWWANYDPGMDPDLLTRGLSISLSPLCCALTPLKIGDTELRRINAVNNQNKPLRGLQPLSKK